jgi:methylglutaconyl-CoA hydratase
MTQPFVITQKSASGIATVTLNRPDVHNAFDEVMIAQLTDAFKKLGADAAVRAVVVQAEGKSFSAGGDLNWMRRAAGYGYAENVADAQKLGDMLHSLAHMPKLTVAKVQGAAYGGGVGLVAACDVAVAHKDAKFCLSEVRLGLIPAVISPYVAAAMGTRHARRYFMTAEVFTAKEAQRINLVHELATSEKNLTDKVDGVLKAVLGNAPGAVAEAKVLVDTVTNRRKVDKDMVLETATIIAQRRATPEAKEGIGAFLDKRKPNWVKA